MRMERRVGSGVLKKKNSSGCLIIKKPGLNKNTGGGFGGEIESSEGKKRGRLVESDSSDDSSESDSSSDEDESLEFMRRKACDKRLKNGAMGYKRKELENSEHDRGRDNAGSEMKRSRMDLFEFDEYDEFDEAEMRNEFFGHGFKGSGKMKGSGVSSKRNFVVDKRRFDGSGSRKSKGKGLIGVGNKGLESEDDEAMPISLLRLKYQETAGESIRLQGKNGVLKVMVNKKKKVDIPSQPVVYERKERKGSRSDDAKKDVVQSPVSSDLKTPEKRGLMVDKEKKVQPSSKGKKAGNSEVDGVDTVLKLATPRPEASSSKKREKTEFITPVKGKEGKEGSAKRAGSTEKQRLREQIRQMLLDAGWTIDLRPRRNRDYLDSVYINPSGTAYWSIVKAYDAFKKQSGEDNGTVKADVGSPSSAPLSEDMINKLTRQTKKKIEEAMKRKRKEASMSKSAKKGSESSDSDESDDRLSSYMNKKQKSRGISSKVDTDRIIQGRASKVPGRCTLLVRGSNTDENSDVDGFVQYSGKRTVLAWLIDCGTAKLSEKVQYMNRRRSRVMLEGWITRDGIHCGCCSKILTVSKFELHAGSKLRQPYQNIFLESGSSLLQCQIDAWNSQEESARQDYFTVDVDGDDPDDDTCGICGDGGDLICCDSCPSTFHQICLGIQLLPSGDWHCPHCTCKFCGSAAEHAAEKDNSTGNELDRCHFCEKKYHKSCSERECTLPQSSNEASFCGPKCQEIYDHLEKILGIKHELEAGISWSLIQRKDLSDTSQRGFPVRVECNAKLAVASSAMDECFLPINDRRSGLNMIHNVVYNCGSNFNRLNFCRFYTAILERGDEIIAAASIRIHGDCLAEMPFIATRMIYRRQGMCRRLLSAIETELRSLKVRQLVIPAISEHMNTWTTVFGFHELTDVHKKEIKTMNMLVFPGTDMLQKTLLEDENSDGAKVSGSTNSQQQQLPIPVKKSEVNSSVEQNREVNSSVEQNREASSDSEEQNGQESKMEVDVLTTPSGEGGVHESNNAAPDVVCESDVHLLDKGSTAEMENTQKESSENKPNAMDDSNGCKIEAPCLKSSPVSSDETREAADANGGIERGNELSEDAEPSNIVSNGRLEPHPGYVSELSSAVKATHKNQDSAPISASVDEESTVAECDVVVDHPEIDKPELSSAVKVTHKNHDSAPIFALISAASGIVGPDADLDSMALHDSAPISAPISAASVDEGPDADLDSTALLKAECDVVVDRPEVKKPDGEINAIDLPESNESLSITQVAVDCSENDTPYAENKSTDRPQTSEPNGKIEVIDLPKTNEDMSMPQVTVDCPENDKPYVENKSTERPQTSEPNGGIDTIDLPETNEDLSIPHVVVDCPTTDKPGGENWTINHPETNEDLSVPIDGEKGTIETNELGEKNKSIEYAESDEPNEHQTRLVMQNTAATEDMSSDFQF